MLFKKGGKQKMRGQREAGTQETGPVTQNQMIESIAPKGRNADPTANNEKVWLELARLEQEVAELALVVARKHEEAAQLWETVADSDVKTRVRELAMSAWTLEREVLGLVETALKQAKGELQNA